MYRAYRLLYPASTTASHPLDAIVPEFPVVVGKPKLTDEQLAAVEVLVEDGSGQAAPQCALKQCQ